MSANLRKVRGFADWASESAIRSAGRAPAVDGNATGRAWRIGGPIIRSDGVGDLQKVQIYVGWGVIGVSLLLMFLGMVNPQTITGLAVGVSLLAFAVLKPKK
jgi:hypothetical protein